MYKLAEKLANEMGALAMNALGALRGELPLQVYNPG